MDYYIYLMWDARAGDISIQDGNGFTSVWTGILYRNPILGNEEGLPGYDPDLPTVLEVDYDDGNGVRPWKIIRLESSPLPQASPLTLTYTFMYV